MKRTWDEIREEVEKALREGRIPDARAALTAFTARRVPRPELPECASLLARAGLEKDGLRLLARYVRPSPRSPAVPTEAEKAEYAICLVRHGAVDEATELLRSIDAKKAPRAQFYLAIALAARWAYADSVAPLRRYLASSGLTRYQRLVAKVNLASALVYERDEASATALLREVIHEANTRQYPLLLANALELSSEHFILLRQWREAERCLETARGLIGKNPSVYTFLLDKWSAILDFMRGRAKHLDGLRKLARSLGQWETLRECDRFLAVREKNTTIARRLYFGTPFEGYRRRLMTEMRGKIDPGEFYLWCPGQRAAATDARTIDLLVGDVTEKGRLVAELRTGFLNHRLLASLSADFYRPRRIATIYEAIHPGAHFRGQASAARVHEGIRLLRLWLEEHRIPLEILATPTGYSLRGEKGVAIRVPARNEISAPATKELLRLRERWAGEWFSIAEAVTHLSEPRRSVQRILQSAFSEGLVEKAGNARSTRYRLVARS